MKFDEISRFFEGFFRIIIFGKFSNIIREITSLAEKRCKTSSKFDQKTRFYSKKITGLNLVIQANSQK